MGDVISELKSLLHTQNENEAEELARLELEQMEQGLLLFSDIFVVSKDF
jgi:hypothetical protein